LDKIRLNKIKASTLTEVVVAVSILGIVIALSFSILSSISLRTDSNKTLQIESKIDGVINQFHNRRNLVDTEIECDNFNILVEFSQSIKSDKLYVGYFTALDKQENELMEKKAFFIKPNMEE
jgi:type II secretory pathway pseudopilin PulG